MKRLVIILIMALCVPFCTVYAQDCSSRIQSAGNLYDKYKKSKDKKQLDEARKQLKNIIDNSSNPENCRKSASELLKKFKPVVATKAKQNVEVSSIVVKVDTIVETHVNIDTIVNVIVKHDSLKVKRFYETEAAAMECARNKDYECAVDMYQTAVAYGKELQMGEGVIRVFESKLERNQQLQYNKLLDEAKRLENKVEINNALSAYEQVLRYGVENNLLDDNAIRNMENKIAYLESVQQMFEFVAQAEEYYQASEWEMAKDELEVAIELADTLQWKRGTIHWRHRVDTLERIIYANETVFDYAELAENAVDYERVRPQIMYEIQSALLRLKTVPTDTLTVKFLILPDSRYKTEIYQQGPSDTVMLNAIMAEIEKSTIRFSPPVYYGQRVNAVATYDFIITVESEIIKIARHSSKRKFKMDPVVLSTNDVYDFIKKTEDTLRSMVLHSGVKKFLYGDFYLQNTVVSVDNDTRSGFNLVKYNGTGGPANVFLSMIIPGLGRHRVTYGEQTGVGTTLFFFGSLGATIGLRYWSLHDNPLNVNNNLDMKDFFKVGKYTKESFEGMEKGQPKRIFYYTSYAFAGLAAVIYVSDVLYTLIRGSVNASRQAKYKKWCMGAYYEPASKTPVIQFNYKIQ